MSEITVNLPGSVGDFVAQQVASGRYASASEYVAHLVEQARRNAARQRLAELILEGEESGEGVEFTDEWWEGKMAELRAEAERRRSA